MLFLHIIIAIFSLITASIAAYRPSRQTLSLTYVVTAGTFLSGVLLMVMEPVSITRACISGGLYLAAVVTLILVARRKSTSAVLY